MVPKGGKVGKLMQQKDHKLGLIGTLNQSVKIDALKMKLATWSKQM